VNAAELLGGLRRADYHHDGGIRCLQLFRLSPGYAAGLRSEVERLCQAERGSDVTRPSHVTHWTRPLGMVTQFSLLSKSGRYDDYSTDHDLSCRGKSFHGQSTYPLLSMFVAAFPHAVNFRVNVLGPGAELRPHEENLVIRTRNGKVGARVRLHLPVITNPGAELVLDGSVFSLSADTVYLVNHGCVHSARNGGSASRVHLVFDLLLTQDVFDRLFGGSPPALPLTALERDNREVVPRRTEGCLRT
jgi:hypothetical protein